MGKATPYDVDESVQRGLIYHKLAYQMPVRKSTNTVTGDYVIFHNRDPLFSWWYGPIYHSLRYVTHCDFSVQFSRNGSRMWSARFKDPRRYLGLLYCGKLDHFRSVNKLRRPCCRGTGLLLPLDLCGNM